MLTPAACRCAVPGITAAPTAENARHFQVIILGPAQSPYDGSQPPLLTHAPHAPRAAPLADGARDRGAVRAGGMFKMELFLPEDYPMAPPKVRFLTNIYHPNVDKLGVLPPASRRAGCRHRPYTGGVGGGRRAHLSRYLEGQVEPGAANPDRAAQHPGENRSLRRRIRTAICRRRSGRCG